MESSDFIKILFLYGPLFLAPLLFSLLDFITLTRSKLKNIDNPPEDTKVEKKFSILIPIFGDLKYLKNVEFLKSYGNRVILCTTDKETDKFNHEISEISKKYGFRIFRSPVKIASGVRPNPWKLFTKTLHGGLEQEELSDAARDEIIKDSFVAVHTKYSIFLDGDTVSKDNFEKLVGHFRDKDYDIASVRVLASKEETLAEKLQAIEYRVAMDARKVYPWLTSGACMVAKTHAIKEIMRHHSLFFSGGDIEIGKLARLMKFKVGYIPFSLYTDVPATFGAWFKQRMAWCGGGFRHCIINMHRYSWRHPLYFLYTTVVVYGATPIRWYEMIKNPWVVSYVIVLYWFLLFVFQRKYWKWYYFLFPIYALVQVMFIVPLGMFTYLRMAIRGKNIGHIKLRHKKKIFYERDKGKVLAYN